MELMKHSKEGEMKGKEEGTREGGQISCSWQCRARQNHSVKVFEEGFIKL